MSNINFKSKWVEKCVRRVLDKPEGTISAEEILQIKYAKAGGDFSGSIVLELSTSLPPEPFAAFDGGDEWAVCLYSDTTLGGKYKLEDYISIDDDNDIWLDHSKTGEWEYAYSEKASKEWAVFEKSIVKNNIFDDYTNEEIDALGEELLPAEDLKLLTGLIVLRLYETELDSTRWFCSFPELKVLELAENRIKEEKENINVFSGLKQITIWCD